MLSKLEVRDSNDAVVYRRSAGDTVASPDNGVAPGTTVTLFLYFSQTMKTDVSPTVELQLTGGGKVTAAPFGDNQGWQSTTEGYEDSVWEGTLDVPADQAGTLPIEVTAVLWGFCDYSTTPPKTNQIDSDENADDGYNPGTVIQIPDLALTDGKTYQYQIEAVDQRGNRSGLSAPVSVTPVAGPGWSQ